jgi:rRNA maturation endonuclease Nob1
VANSYHCFACKKVLMILGDTDQTRCPSCGGTRGELLTQEQVKEGMERGTYFNIDPRKGKRAKNKRKR